MSGIFPPVPQFAPAGQHHQVFVLETDWYTTSWCTTSQANTSARNHLNDLKAQFDNDVARMQCSVASPLGGIKAPFVLKSNLETNVSLFVYQVKGVMVIQLNTTC
jgi:hypothetical protein